MADATTETPNCPKCGGPMWDNRIDKKNPRAPDFKCKDRECDGVIWPPRDPNAPKPPAQDPNVIVPPTDGGPACPECGNAMWDNTVNKKNPRAPDYKCKRGPKWPDTNGCQGVIWPPKEGEAPRAGAKKTAATKPKAAASKATPAADYDSAPRQSGGSLDEDEDLPF